MAGVMQLQTGRLSIAASTDATVDKMHCKQFTSPASNSRLSYTVSPTLFVLLLTLKSSKLYVVSAY